MSILKRLKGMFSISEELRFQRLWRDSLMDIRGKKHYNESNESFVIRNVEKQEFGMTGYVEIPKGLSLDGFLSIKDTMEASCKCLLIPKYKRDDGIIDVVAVHGKRKFSFKPVKCGEEYVLVGYDEFGKAYLLDLTTSTPHLLVTGASGTGKSFICYMIIANLIYSWDKETNDFDIILLQIMKTELSAFEDCVPCKKYGMLKELKDVANALEKIEIQAKRRGDILENSKVRTWNKNNGSDPSKKMKPLYVCIDELAFFMPLSSDDVFTKNLKKKCINHLIQIGRAGRSAGVHIIALCQRGTAANLDSNLKSNFARLTAFQNSVVDSQVVIDCSDATKLLDREVILKSSNGLKMLYIPTLKEDCSDLREFVPDMKVPTPKTKEQLDDLDKAYEEFGGFFNAMNNIYAESNSSYLEGLDNVDLDTGFEAIVSGNADVNFVDGENGKTKIVLTKPKLTENDKLILDFVDKYGAITAGTAIAIRGTKKAAERLKYLEDNGYLKSEKLIDIESTHSVKNEKIYYKKKSNDIYNLYICLYLYGVMYKKGYKIKDIDFNKKLYYGDTISNRKCIEPLATIITTRGEYYLETDYGRDINDLSMYKDVGGRLVVACKKTPEILPINAIVETYTFSKGQL